MAAPQPARGEGNPNRHYMFTAWRLPTETMDEESRTLFHFIMWQEEISPETGRHHWQGYVELKNPMRLGAVKRDVLKQNDAHLEKRRGTQEQAVAYCEKDETAVVGTRIRIGQLQRQGQRSDLEGFKEDVKAGLSKEQLMEKHSDTMARSFRFCTEYLSLKTNRAARTRGYQKMEVVVVTGATNKNKTRWVMHEIRKQFGLNYYAISAPDPGRPVYFDNYAEEPCLLIDEFSDWISCIKMLRLLDGYDNKLDARGITHVQAWTHVYITSNLKMEDWWEKHPPNSEHRNALARRITRAIHIEPEDPPLAIDAQEEARILAELK